MKALDIIKQLQAVLPRVTNLFTEDVTVALNYSSGVVTAVTQSNHGLVTNDYVNIVDSNNPTAITTISRAGKVLSITVSVDHDLTLGKVDIKLNTKVVVLTGSNEAEFNGTFKLIGVENRRKFTLETVDTGATTATGTPLAQNASVLDGFNGRHKITVTNSTTFTYPVTQVLHATANGTPLVKSDARISGAIALDIAEAAYTKQGQDELWAFVVLGDVIASKNRSINSDMTDVARKNTGINQRLSQPFTVYVFAPTTSDRSGRAARDLMEDVAAAMFKSLIGVNFDTGLYSGTQYVSTFVNHGFASFNGAYYVHEFNFELAADITFEDTTGYEFDTAFRNIDIEINPDFGTQENPATATIDLDEVEL